MLKGRLASNTQSAASPRRGVFAAQVIGSSPPETRQSGRPYGAKRLRFTGISSGVRGRPSRVSGSPTHRIRKRGVTLMTFPPKRSILRSTGSAKVAQAPTMSR